MRVGKLGLIIWLAFCAGVAGCVSLPKSYSTKVRPLYPKLGDSVSNFYQTIDTLTPVLRWSDIKSEGQTYDVAVWESPSEAPDESITGTPIKPRKWGKQVYYVQAVSQNYFKISKPLKPKTCYHWSVRLRTGSKTSEWATFSQSAVSPIGIGYAYHLPFGFITPGH